MVFVVSTVYMKFIELRIINNNFLLNSLNFKAAWLHIIQVKTTKKTVFTVFDGDICKIVNLKNS